MPVLLDVFNGLRHSRTRLFAVIVRNHGHSGERCENGESPQGATQHPPEQNQGARDSKCRDNRGRRTDQKRAEHGKPVAVRIQRPNAVDSNPAAEGEKRGGEDER
jgi:hypothetical protein